MSSIIYLLLTRTEFDDSWKKFFLPAENVPFCIFQLQKEQDLSRNVFWQFKSFVHPVTSSILSVMDNLLQMQNCLHSPLYSVQSEFPMLPLSLQNENQRGKNRWSKVEV